MIDPILQSTYLGGRDTDGTKALAINPLTGDVYVAGYTHSTNFPATPRGAQQTNVGGNTKPVDAFVAKLTINLTAGNILSISPKLTNCNITSSPGAINCGSGGSMCSADFYGTVTLTATPSTGYTFAGWTGDCSGCGVSTTCTITMKANKTCSANFKQAIVVALLVVALVLVVAAELAQVVAAVLVATLVQVVEPVLAVVAVLDLVAAPVLDLVRVAAAVVMFQFPVVVAVADVLWLVLLLWQVGGTSLHGYLPQPTCLQEE